MSQETLIAVLDTYNLQTNILEIESYGSGLINHTWQVVGEDKKYILQKINDTVFKKPEAIAHNIALIADYLKHHHPEYIFMAPIENKHGQQMVYMDNVGYFRLFPFLNGSHTIDVVKTPEQAYEAARQFGKFTRVLSGFDSKKMQETIPHFHDLSERYEVYSMALREGDQERIKAAYATNYYLNEQKYIVAAYSSIVKNPQFKQRVTHCDTKISNVLFDSTDKGLCIIDLDTMMRGYFISDVGDMMRTYLSPVSEDETDFSKITVRDEFFKAIVDGYYAEMGDELSAIEKLYFTYAGKFMIYMQALRFMTDYLNNDVYYGARYPKHNLVRAQNQVALLQQLIKKGY
jgi:Ser/Thr protein kinase RdoA (MazF antagonist)